MSVIRVESNRNVLDYSHELNILWKQSVPIACWLYVLGVAEFAMQHVDDFDGKHSQTWVYKQDCDTGFYDFATPTKQVLQFL